jgi:hypothetical protein
VSTTCQFIVDRAKGFNALNGPLAADSTEMLTRIRAIQKRIFTACAGLTRDRFKITAPLTSTAGTSERSFDVSNLTPPLERILQIKLADGRTLNQVDELDLEAEFAPRYIVRGTSVVEVASDWRVSTGAVSATLLYVYGPSTINPTGTLSGQSVTIPDEWTDTVILPLAMYLFGKDPGRDPGEYVRLEAQYKETWQGFVEYLTNYGGNESRRFELPAPPEIGKR